MRHIFSAFKQALKNILILALISFLSFSSLFIFPIQPSLAAAPTERQPTLQKGIDKTSKAGESAASREQTYEEEIGAINKPEGIEKEYEENLKAYEESQPNKGLVEKAEELVEKVTGQE